MTFLAFALCSSYTQKVMNCSERGVTEGAEWTKVEQIASGRNIKKRSKSFVLMKEVEKGHVHPMMVSCLLYLK